MLVAEASEARSLPHLSLIRAQLPQPAALVPVNGLKSCSRSKKLPQRANTGAVWSPPPAATRAADETKLCGPWLYALSSTKEKLVQPHSR